MACRPCHRPLAQLDTVGGPTDLFRFIEGICFEPHNESGLIDELGRYPIFEWPNHFSVGIAVDASFESENQEAQKVSADDSPYHNFVQVTHALVTLVIRRDMINQSIGAFIVEYSVLKRGALGDEAENGFLFDGVRREGEINLPNL